MTTWNDRTACPEPDTLAAFAEGKLERHELPPILAHVDRCVRCTAAVEAVNEEIGRHAAEPSAPRVRGRWLVAAAAIIALLAVAAILVLLERRPSVERLVALAPEDARLTEPRLSGGFAWAPYRGPVRDRGAAGDARLLQLGGIAGELDERAARSGTAEAQHAAGIAMVVIGRPEEAVERLERATRKAPRDAAIWSDLAAARYAVAVARSRASLLSSALAAADVAVRHDPRLPEARFNRALILERLRLVAYARQAWNDYLALDAASPWAAEARRRLAALPATTGDAEFRRQLPRLERSAAEGDAATVASIVTRFPQQSRAFAEAEHLGRWGEAVRSGDAAEAARLLAVAHRVGDAVAAIAGESLLREAVRAIHDADPSRRARLAEAHAVYRRARIAFSRQQPSAAEADFRLAAELFEAGRSPMALVARYYEASTAYEQNAASRAAAQLETMLAELDQQPRFASLSAQVRWELALCRMLDEEWEGARTLLDAARTTFATLGEKGNQAFIDSLLATTLVTLGRPDDAWISRIHSFEALSAAGADERLALSIGGAARMAMRAGNPETAAPLLALERDAVRGNDVLLANVLVREAVLHSVLGDDAASLASARRAAAAARRIADPALRARAQSDAAFATAAAVLADDPRRAKALLDEAIEAYESRQMLAFLPESHLLRARVLERLGHEEAAAHDLENGIALIERHPIRLAGSVAGTGVLDAGTALFEEAIRLALDRRDAAAAFRYAERSRGRARPSSPSLLSRRLRGSSAAVLELVVLPREVAVFAVNEAGLTSWRTPYDRSRLTMLASRARGGDEAASRELYDVLIRPAETALARARQLVVVADPLLANVPFAALYDSRSRTYLVEKMSVAIAPDATSLQVGPSAPLQAVLALALPDAPDAPALAAVEEELADIARSYDGRSVPAPERPTFSMMVDAARGADVLHLAGHTERQPGRGDAALLFGRERVSWKTISAARLSVPIVVLSACETLRPPPGREQRALSLGGGFLAAGASAVIGTLEPIADSDARELFPAVHRQLALGAGAAEAVRRAQLGSLRDPSSSRGGWRSLSLLTNRISTEQENRWVSSTFASRESARR